MRVVSGKVEVSMKEDKRLFEAMWFARGGYFELL
jgi:hypothetical protein